MPAATAQLVAQSGSLVRRARAGDQNAMALIVRIGQKARSKATNERARAAFAAIKRYIETHPVGAGPMGVAIVAGEDNLAAVPSALIAHRMRIKPILPHAFFDGLDDPERTEVIIARACKYRGGVPAAVIVLAGGAPITAAEAQTMGVDIFGNDSRLASFKYGLANSSDRDWKMRAPALDPAHRRALLVGQCVARAQKLQTLRAPNSRIADFNPIVGWELGE